MIDSLLNHGADVNLRDEVSAMYYSCSTIEAYKQMSL